MSDKVTEYLRSHIPDFDSLPPDEQMYEWVEETARRSFRHHQGLVRGTTVTRSDSYATHIIHATLKWVGMQKKQTFPKENT